MFFFNPISLKPALQHYGKLDEVQDALENDHDVFSLWNFEDKLLSKAIKTGNSVRMKNILRKALRGEDIKLVVLRDFQTKLGRDSGLKYAGNAGCPN